MRVLAHVFAIRSENRFSTFLAFVIFSPKLACNDVTNIDIAEKSYRSPSNFHGMCQVDIRERMKKTSALRVAAFQLFNPHPGMGSRIMRTGTGRNLPPSLPTQLL